MRYAHRSQHRSFTRVVLLLSVCLRSVLVVRVSPRDLNRFFCRLLYRSPWEKERTRRDEMTRQSTSVLNRQGKPLYDWCSLSFEKSHWSPNPVDCTYLWSTEQTNASVPPTHLLVRPVCVPWFSFPANRLAVFPVILMRRTFSALTKSMYPSSLMSNSSSFDTKHSSCSSIHRKTLSVLRLNELYWRYSSISFLRCCQALRTVSSLFFKIFETSSKREKSHRCNWLIRRVTFDFLFQRL